jgi:hypothetical protein
MSAGAIGILTGISLSVLALGTTVALSGPPGSATVFPPAAWLLLVAGLVFAAGGLLTFVVGRALLRRLPLGRTAALALAVPGLLVVPFGTALAIYSFWTLVNDDARREYGK